MHPSLSPGRLSNLVHGEGYTFVDKRLIIVSMNLHQDSVSNILVVVNLQMRDERDKLEDGVYLEQSSPGDEGRRGTSH